MMKIFNNILSLLPLLAFISSVRADGERDDSNTGLAFALVIAAGLSTTIGASFVFCDGVVKQDNFKFLGAALGFAGGIMIYIALVEILQGSFEEFNEIFIEEEDEAAATGGRRLDGGEEGEAKGLFLGTLMFFIGVIIIYVLDFVVHKLYGKAGSPLASKALIGQEREHAEELVRATPNQLDRTSRGNLDVAERGEVDDTESEEATKLRLRQMGIVTAIALGLHNLPEGIATFVGTLEDPAVGVSLAFAIAIHNIPEGLCVAIPIYYATGSRWQGFWFSFVSGLAEILGAVGAWLFLDVDETAFGITFGIVAGMMTCIVLRELLPTALRYDPKDKYVTNSLFVGAAVMAFSILLFSL